MKTQFGRILVAVGAITLLATPFTTGAASATATGVAFSDANFHGYASGTEVHLGALTVSGTTLVNLDQAFSGASTSTAGLTSLIRSETTNVVQPAKPASVKAYGRGSGVELGIGTKIDAVSDPNQIMLAGLAESTAPPNSNAVTSKQVTLPLKPVANAILLQGQAASVFDPTQCPIGEPISYGAGLAANAQALILSPTAPVLNTAGPGTSTAQTTSDTFMSNNGDGTWGLSTQAADIIAPITVNVLNAVQVVVNVHSATSAAGGAPVSLTAKTTGESSGAGMHVSANDLLTISLKVGTTVIPFATVDLNKVQKGGVHIPLSTADLGTTFTEIDGVVTNIANQILAPLGPALGSALGNPALTNLLNTLGTTVSDITNKVATVNLGYLDIDTTPHAIGGSVSSPATVIGGTKAAGAMDLIHLNITPSVTVGSNTTALPQIVDLRAGHVEASATDQTAVNCSIPIVKTSTPTSVSAGQSFTYNIQVPDPAKANLIDCDLSNIKVIDTINDFSGTPSFKVETANQGGVINQTSDNSATVTWTGLSWKTGTPPLDLAITVSVPSGSTAGVVQDIVVANGQAGNCTGGISGKTGVGTASGANGATLTGTFRLTQPSVSAAGAGPSKSTLPAKLPFTGAMGGIWQPIAGVTVLGLGGGALALARRARRRQQG